MRSVVPAGFAKLKKPKVWDIWTCPACRYTFAPCTEDGVVLGHPWGGNERLKHGRKRWCPGGKAEHFE